MAENVGTLLYSGFIEELVDILDVKQEPLMVSVRSWLLVQLQTSVQMKSLCRSCYELMQISKVAWTVDLLK